VECSADLVLCGLPTHGRPFRFLQALVLGDIVQYVVECSVIIFKTHILVYVLILHGVMVVTGKFCHPFQAAFVLQGGGVGDFQSMYWVSWSFLFSEH